MCDVEEMEYAEHLLYLEAARACVPTPKEKPPRAEPELVVRRPLTAIAEA